MRGILVALVLAAAWPAAAQQEPPAQAAFRRYLASSAGRELTAPADLFPTDEFRDLVALLARHEGSLEWVWARELTRSQKIYGIFAGLQVGVFPDLEWLIRGIEEHRDIDPLQNVYFNLIRRRQGGRWTYRPDDAEQALAARVATTAVPADADLLGRVIPAMIRQRPAMPNLRRLHVLLGRVTADGADYLRKEFGRLDERLVRTVFEAFVVLEPRDQALRRALGDVMVLIGRCGLDDIERRARAKAIAWLGEQELMARLMVRVRKLKEKQAAAPPAALPAPATKKAEPTAAAPTAPALPVQDAPRDRPGGWPWPVSLATLIAGFLAGCWFSRRR